MSVVYELLGKEKNKKTVELPRAANPDEQVSVSEFLPSGPGTGGYVFEQTT